MKLIRAAQLSLGRGFSLSYGLVHQLCHLQRAPDSFADLDTVGLGRYCASRGRGRRPLVPRVLTLVRG